MDAAHVAILAGVGLGAGIVSALFGVGGGLLMVPVLHYGLGFDWPTATAVSLLAIALQTPTGVLGHARRSAVDWRIAVPLALGGLLGVIAGDRLEPHAPVPWLKVLFAALMGLAAWRLVQPAPQPRLDGQHPALLLALGVGAGIVSQLLGIGGGLLTVPILALLGVPIHVAVGTSLVPVFTNAALATGIHLAHEVPMAAGIVLGAGSLLGVPLGVRLAHALADAGLRRAFAVALVVAAIAIAVTSGIL